MSSDLRQVESYLRQIESANYQAAMARASREIQHDNYRLARALRDAGYEDGHVSSVLGEKLIDG